MNWQTTLSGRKRSFLYSEDQPLSGTRTILPTQQLGRMFEQIELLDFQKDETNSDTAWKWNIVLEEMEKKFETSYTVSDTGWPDVMNGIEAAHQNARRAAQGRQRRQRYMDNSIRGLRPRYLQRKAQEYLMERPNKTWNDFCAQIIQKDLILEVSSTFLSHEAQTKAELATLGQEIENLRSDLKDYHINAVAIISRTFHTD